MDENCRETETAADGFDFAVFDYRRTKFFGLNQRAESGVRRECPIENPLCAIQTKWLRLSQRKQAGDVIKLRIGKKNGVDRRPPDGVISLQIWE